MSEEYENLSNNIIKKSEEFQEQNSGWALQKIMFLEVNKNKYEPMRASSYIALPKFIKSRKAVINIKNNDNACFAWCGV